MTGTCAAEGVRVSSAAHLNVLEAVLTEVHISVHHIRSFAYKLSECQLLSKSAFNFYSVPQHVPETTLRLHHYCLIGFHCSTFTELEPDTHNSISFLYFTFHTEFWLI